jgi:hypothetical protein
MDHAGVYVWPSDEQQLLLEAGLLDGQRAIDAFRAWRSRVRLEDDFTLATARLLPLAYENLHRLGVADPIMQRLKGVYRHTWYGTNRLLHAAATAISALVEAEVPVLLTKGVPLALTYYNNLALRPMADVDVVVPSPFLDKALGILESEGWHGPWPEPEVRRFRHAIGWVGPRGQELDIHWRPMYESQVDAAEDSFFSTSEPLDFRGTIVRQPDPTHALFLTVIHGVRFNPVTPVRWIPDSVTILRARGAEVDWKKIEALAVSYRVVQRLHLGLSYLARSFDAAVPPAVLDGLKSTRTTLFERFESRVVLADDGSLNPSTIRNQLSWLAEYARHTPARNPLSFAVGYTHYMRYKLGLSGRRQLLGRIMQGVKRKIMNGHTPSNPAGSPS